MGIKDILWFRWLICVLTWHYLLITASAVPNVQSPTSCHLGQLPGTWIEGASPGDRYQLLTEPGSLCQIKNYIKSLVHQAPQISILGDNSPHQVSILFLGDSVDR
jgi:hypothetical protein